jgi:predicted phage terminase large subunit-like protein
MFDENSIKPSTAAQALLDRRALRESLVEWARFVAKEKGWKIAKHHILLLEKLQAAIDGTLVHPETGKVCRNLMVLMPPGSAKALALNTPIPTPNGWTTMGELREGDFVFGEHGFPVRVVKKSEVFHNRPVFSVKTDCGDCIVADADHEWFVRLCGKREVYHKKTTRYLWERCGAKRPMIKHAACLHLPNIELPLHPYILGYWLGDGHTASGSVTIGHEDFEWVSNEFRRHGFNVGEKTKNYLAYTLPDLRGVLVHLGVLGNKHIPSTYFRASSEQRLSLLQGLIDSDGSVSDSGEVCFTSTLKHLADGVAELVRSLGAKASITETRATLYGKDCGPCWRVHFYLLGAARLPRKSQKTKNNDRTPGTYIDVTFAGVADTACIVVDSPTHLFLCGKSMTPTHNSTYASILFPPWAIQRRVALNEADPDCQDKSVRLLGCSYAAELIESFSRECRNTIETYHKVLGYNLRTDSRAVQEWSTDNGASYRCGGVGAGLSGRRADIGVIDDYLGSEQDANSKTIRDQQWSWYQNDFWPRLKPNAVQIFVANRRHEEDLVGKLLEKEPNKWVVIKIPFFAKENDVLGREVGEPLWPEWFTEDQISTIRALPPRTQAGLYGQEPAPEDGNYFERQHIQTYTRDEYDQLMQLNPRIYGAGDWAVSEVKGSNKTCFGGGALDHRGILFILPDIFWKVAGPKEVVEQFTQFLKRRNPLITWSEKGHISKAWGPFLLEHMLENDVYAYIKEVTPSADKETRAQSIRARMSVGKVRFPAFATWWPDALHQMLTFPGGKEDDFVDFLAHLGAGVNSMSKPTLPTPPQVEDINTPAPITLKWIKKSDRLRRESLLPVFGGR